MDADTNTTPEAPGRDDRPKPLLPPQQATRVKHYARMLWGLGAALAAMLAIGAVFLRSALDSGQFADYLIGGLGLAFGAAQGLHAWVRYRQLCRYLATGSGSAYEDMVRQAERSHTPSGKDGE